MPAVSQHELILTGWKVCSVTAASLTSPARPPTPVRDDFYARRLSDTDRRGSYSTARPVASPMLTVLHLRTSSSSSSLRRMSVFSSTGLSEGDTLSGADGATENRQSVVGRLETDVVVRGWASLKLRQRK